MENENYEPVSEDPLSTPPASDIDSILSKIVNARESAEAKELEAKRLAAEAAASEARDKEKRARKFLADMQACVKSLDDLEARRSELVKQYRALLVESKKCDLTASDLRKAKLYRPKYLRK